jgi:uncharacterized Rossmann fold enzyme
MRKTKQKKLSETAEELSLILRPHQLWRTIPADAFDEHRRLQVLGHVAEYLTTIKEWKEALAGDAACAVRIALQMRIPDDHICYPVDARMTLLLHCALNGSAAAALVLAHLLRKMPLDGAHKNRLATSWLVRNFRALPGVGSLEEGPRHRRRSIAAVLLGKEEDWS